MWNRSFLILHGVDYAVLATAGLEVISSWRGFIPAGPGDAGRGFAVGREAPLTGAGRAGSPSARREEVADR